MGTKNGLDTKKHPCTNNQQVYFVVCFLSFPIGSTLNLGSSQAMKPIALDQNNFNQLQNVQTP